MMLYGVLNLEPFCMFLFMNVFIPMLFSSVFVTIYQIIDKVRLELSVG